MEWNGRHFLEDVQSDSFAESKITQLTLAVFVRLNRDTKLITNIIIHKLGQANDATDLVSCDLVT